VRKNNDKIYSEDLANALTNCQSAKFWNIFNSRTNNKRVHSNCVDGYKSSNDIVKAFMDVFKVVNVPNDVVFHKQATDTFNSILNSVDNDENYSDLTIEDIETAVSALKAGKSPGFDLVTSEHITNAHPVLLSCLKILFSLMIRCNYVPNAFGIGILIPLQKSTDVDLSSSSNYRV